MRFFLLLFIVLNFCCAFSQKLDDELVNRASELSKIYDEAQVVLLNSQSNYSFYLDRKTDHLNAQRNEKHNYLALTSNVEFVIRLYFNDKSYIDDYSIEADKGKSFSYNKLCGHFQSGDVFYSDAQICAYKLNFEYKGRSALFQANTVYTDPKYITQIFFHDDVPVLEREIKIEVPVFADIELVEMNFEDYDISKQVTKGEVTTYTYKLKNIKALESSDDTPGHLHYLPHILILTKSYQSKGQSVSVLSSTDDLYSWYRQLTSDLKYDAETLKEMARGITDGLSSDQEKVEAIYYWVQDNIKYIAFENGLAGFKPEEAEKVLYNRYGDCKGMANLTKSMLRTLGFNARLAWLGTSIIPYTYDIPSLAVDNHMVCTVDLAGKRFVLDATEKFNSLGYNAERIQGKQILIENNEDYIIDTVTVEPLDRYLQESKLIYSVKNNQLTGKGTSNFQGEHKKELIHFIDNQKKEDLDKILQTIVSGNSNMDYFKINEHSDFKRKEPLTISYDINLKDHLNAFGNEMYLDLDYSEEFKDAEVEEDRLAPLSFGRKRFERTVAEFIIPSGYMISYLPSNLSVANDYYAFNFNYEKKGNKIIYSKEVKIFNKTLPESQFKEWNLTIDQVNKFYNDQIILKSTN